ncbi:MAG: MATE family efflux transporter [Myxococcota bacterium]|nr:MATE family efflux transporter [Myxococcota bacterium]
MLPLVVLRLAVPASAQGLLHTAVFLADRAMLARHGTDSLAAMQLCGPLLWSTSSVLGAFTIGTVALVGRAVGASDRALAAAAVRAALALALVLGTLCTAILLALSHGLDRLFPAAGAATWAAARGYLAWASPAMPALMAATAAGAALAAAGDTRSPMLAALLANAVNVAVGWLLIFGHAGLPSMGAAGAGAGTAAAGLVELAVLFFVLRRSDGAVTLAGAGGERQAAVRIARVSLPALVERVAQHAGFLGFVSMIGALGPLAMAANQAVVSLESVSFLTIEGFATAAAAVVAQKLGAADPAQARRGALVALAMAEGFALLVALLFATLPGALLSAFSPGPEAVRTGLPCMFVAATAQPFMAAADVLGQALRGAGATRSTLLVVLMGGLLVRLSATALFVFGLGLGLTGVWLGSTVDWIVRAGLSGWLFARGDWARARV